MKSFLIMQREIEIFSYSFGTSKSIRILVTVNYPKVYCSTHLDDVEHNSNVTGFPIDYDKIRGFFNQYLIALGLNSQIPDPDLYKHMEMIAKYLKIVNAIGFEKLSSFVLNNFLIEVQNGLLIWKRIFSEYELLFTNEQRERIIKVVSHFIMMFHLLCDEHLHDLPVGITFSPLCNK